VEDAVLNYIFGGAASLEDIADFFELSLEEVMEILRELEERGLVKVRESLVELTERGKRYLERNVWELHVHAPW